MPGEEDLLYRQMPHNLEAEQAVLGSMLIDQNCIKDVMDKLQPEDFYLQQNREIFETIYTMFCYSRPIDPVTVVGEMQKNGTFDENTTKSYMIQLMDITPTSANVMEYVELVRGKSLLRKVAMAAGEITAMVQEGGGEPESVLEAAEQKIYAVRQGRAAQDMAPIGTVLASVLDNIEAMSAEGGRLPDDRIGRGAADRHRPDRLGRVAAFEAVAGLRVVDGRMVGENAVDDLLDGHRILLSQRAVGLLQFTGDRDRAGDAGGGEGRVAGQAGAAVV